MQILSNYSLKKYHTFATDVYAKYFTEVNSVAQFKDLLQNDIYKNNPLLIIGGGSNLLFTKNYDGLVIKNNLHGIEIVKQDDNHVFIKSAAGENWHRFVLWCVNHNYGGIENLSLIPGCVGASPMQNIGAYGVEIKDVCEQVNAIDVMTGEEKTFANKDCQFGYRESVFKHIYKNKYLITSVVFKLNKKPVFNTSYGAIEQELKAMGVTQLSVKAISDAVINIRSSKLPDPAKIGNAGSFFKNPEVSKQKHDELKQQYPNLVAYVLDNGNYKLAAGWLIEQCGFKGKRVGDAGVHVNQALVLVNYGEANGSEIYNLSQQILDAVKNMFGVT
ncbi:MAG TPA: UDP-N-acetylmuramate dehydrogenase, partial [Bacteroidia bacterium]|nr:UDP-N-acetylmuramate dehydrogenase [Bacteroidia bacterium]